MKTRSHRGTVVECRTRDQEVPSSNPSVEKKKNTHRSNQKNTTTNPSAPDLIPEIVRGENQKLPWCSGRVQDYRSSGPQFKPWCGLKENLSQVQSEQYHHQSLCPRVKYLKLSEVKTRHHCSKVVECRTWDPMVCSSHPNVAKKKISHRSNQNNTTTNPSAPELNTWNCQR